MCRCSNEYEYCNECVDRCVTKQQERNMAWVSQTMIDGIHIENMKEGNTVADTPICGFCSAGANTSFVHTWECLLGYKLCAERLAEDKQKLKSISPPAVVEETSLSPKEKDSFHKIPVHLFPPTAIVAGAMVIAQGHRKPGRTIYNWRNKEEAIKCTGYLSAALRHLMKMQDGEDLDEELTELAGVPIPHLWAALSSLAIMIDAQETGTFIDDRKKNGAVADMIKRLTPTLPITQK